MFNFKRLQYRDIITIVIVILPPIAQAYTERKMFLARTASLYVSRKGSIAISL